MYSSFVSFLRNFFCATFLMDNAAIWERQLVEAESIEAIFADEFAVVGSWRQVQPDAAFTCGELVSFSVTLDSALTLRFRLPATYPDSSPPDTEVLWTGPGQASAFRANLESYVASLPLGEEMVYSIVTWCQEHMDEATDDHAPSSAPVAVASAEVPAKSKATEVPGKLSLASYYRAEALGEGACGSVMHVYDDDGQEWAAKQFERAEDGCVDNTTLREIAILRSFRASGVTHPHIINIHDMARINDELCMIMASYKCSLMDALQGGALATAKGSQVRVARGLLGAVAFLHGCKAIHRDIKPGNVMLTEALEPVLIDFSLAKVELDNVLTAERAPRTAREKRRKARGKQIVQSENLEARHSQGVGTPLYMAPEVWKNEDYDNSADIWSTGVVLLEVFDSEFCAKFALCEKEKGAHALISETVSRLGAKPIPAILRGLLETAPSARLSAQEALQKLEATLPEGVKDSLPVLPEPVSLRPLAARAAGDGFDVPADVSAEVKKWCDFFRCSPCVAMYAQAYVARSPLASARPLHAVVLSGRLHESDPEAAPLFDLGEIEEWAWQDEENEEMLEQLGELADYMESEQEILKEIDYWLY
eukprot:TRINITY_DN285_c1_g1_i1.p1 TRINITY_DN285_c1_g1~~TRINITY_DN285_c1_g1_i1.p1  ORF type:complete len:594 (+),score=102.98 TRINITY_DN285_c1_g1_i1:54-1835(+)